MRAHYRVPFWKRFGAWAIPLIGFLIWGYMNISDNISQKQYEERHTAMMAENKKAALDTASYRVYADKYKGIEALIAQNFHDYPNKIMPIDTHSTKLLRMYLGLFLEKKDTSIVFNTENTLFHIPQIVSQDIKEISQDNQNWDQWSNFQDISRSDESILSWYKNNMDNVDGIANSYGFASNIKNTNEKIDKIRYIAVARIVGFVKPSMLGESSFSSGYVKENIYIYDVNTKKLLQKRTIIGKNTNEINTYSNRNSTQSDSERSLLNNLASATNKEIIDDVTNKKKKEDDLPF
jgi:hypothetical protein